MLHLDLQAPVGSILYYNDKIVNLRDIKGEIWQNLETP